MRVHVYQHHRYTDPCGIIHACEGKVLHPDIYLVHTKCGKDVPANQSYETIYPTITCQQCK